MRKLVVWNLVTLDGYFEGTSSWSLDWLQYFWGAELESWSLEQAKSIGALLFGRVTYQGMAAYWIPAEGGIADFMNRVPKFVVSRTLKSADWNNARLIADNAVDKIAGLKQAPGKDIYIFGSARLIATLMPHDLIDEFRLCLTPLILGSGNPHFKPQSARTRMVLLDTRRLDNGCVILRYAPSADAGRRPDPPRSVPS